MNNLRGREGANPATFASVSDYEECDVCHKKIATKKLIIAHRLEGNEHPEHMFVCPACEIPEHYWGCGCGG